MRVATWNVGGGYVSTNNNLEFNTENLDYFIDELEKVKPDITCFQEIHTSKRNDQPRIIANKLNTTYFKTASIASSHLKDGEELALSIVSNYPILYSKFHKLTNPNLKMIFKGEEVTSHDKGFLEIRVLYQGETISVLSGHMVPYHNFGRNFTEDEFKQIRGEIESLITKTAMPTVICADMNFPNIEQLIPKVFKKGYTSILDDEPTTPKGKKLDKIIISKDWIYTKTGIVKGIADHYLCLADIELRKH
jgi:endonuclease/exonuclease/phosphatase family metal-dependent hydrolase